VEGSSEKEQASIEWQDGIVTNGLKRGSWVLLDNFNHGEASVLERLNPVLEGPAEWVLIEKGKKECPNLFEYFDKHMSLFKQLWNELQSEIQAHTKTIEMQQEQCKQRDLNLDHEQARIEQSTSELQDKKREVFADETENQRKKREEEIQNEEENIMIEKLQIGQRMDEAETLAMQYDADGSEKCRAFESQQDEVMKHLVCAVDEAISKMSDLKKHYCFSFLANRHITPGVSAASEFLEHVLAHIACISSARQQVSPASLVLGLGQLFQSRPRLAASAIGRLLVGTFLVPNPFDQTCALLSQGMAIVRTQSKPVLNHYIFGQSLFYIYFSCGANSEDELSVCVCTLSQSFAGNVADVLEVHHWQSHGEGSKGHVEWVDSLINCVKSLGLRVKEHTRSLPLFGSSGMASVSSAESLANGCFLELHTLDLSHTGTSSSAVKELSKEEAGDLCKNLEAAVRRMQKLVSVRDGNSDVTAAGTSCTTIS